MWTQQTLQSRFRQWLREEVGEEAPDVYAPLIEDLQPFLEMSQKEWEQSVDRLQESGHTPELFRGAMEHAKEVQKRDWTMREFLEWVAEGDPGDKAGIPGGFFEDYAKRNLNEAGPQDLTNPATVGLVLTFHQALRPHLDTPGDLDAAPEMDMEEEFAI